VDEGWEAAVGVSALESFVTTTVSTGGRKELGVFYVRRSTTPKPEQGEHRKTGTERLTPRGVVSAPFAELSRSDIMIMLEACSGATRYIKGGR
jgi:hypothetical protein